MAGEAERGDGKEEELHRLERDDLSHWAHIHLAALADKG